MENSANLNKTCIGNIFRARATCNMTPRLGEMRPPVLVINGEYDGSLPAGRVTVSLTPGAEHFVLPNTGHACCIEDPNGFDRGMIRFLSAHGLVPKGALRFG